MASLFSPQLKRLLNYVRPYSFRLGAGILLLAFVALAEGGVALMVAPGGGPRFESLRSGFDAGPGEIALVRSHHLSQRFFSAENPQRLDGFHHSLCLILYVSKAIAEYLGTTEIQYVGQAAVTDLRNQVYARLIRQPMGFFQHNPTGRLNSTVINDVERTRIALSEYLADLFQKGFTFLVFVTVLAGGELEHGAGCGVSPAIGHPPGQQIRPQNSAFGGKQPEPPGGPQPDFAGNG